MPQFVIYKFKKVKCIVAWLQNEDVCMWWGGHILLANLVIKNSDTAYQKQCTCEREYIEVTAQVVLCKLKT
jgi:hypothetical protein